MNSYVLQALGLAATVYEHSSAVAFIGNNDERAKKWERHEDSSRSYPSPAQRKKGIRTLIRTFVPDASDLEARVEHHEQLYEVFCMAKHGNPRALRRFGVAVQGDRVQLYHGPFVTNYVVRQARFALFNASWLTASATAVFADPLLEGAPADRRRHYDRLDATLADLIISLRERDRGETGGKLGSLGLEAQSTEVDPMEKHRRKAPELTAGLGSTRSLPRASRKCGT